MIPLPYYLAVGATLFAIGLIGFLSRRNMILMFLCAELMLQGVTINFVAFSRHHGNLHGQVFTMFILTVAACEAALALALFISLYRTKRSLDVSIWQDLREEGLELNQDTEKIDPVEPEVYPKLPKAGVAPTRTEESTRA